MSTELQLKATSWTSRSEYNSGDLNFCTGLVYISVHDFITFGMICYSAHVRDIDPNIGSMSEMPNQFSFVWSEENANHSSWTVDDTTSKTIFHYQNHEDCHTFIAFWEVRLFCLTTITYLCLQLHISAYAYFIFFSGW